MNQTLRFAVGGNEVIPAASGDVLRVQLQNPVGERIPLVMVKEQPAIQMFFAERGLNFFDMHGLTHHETHRSGCLVRDWDAETTF